MFDSVPLNFFQKANYTLYLALVLGVLLFLSGCKSGAAQALENSASILQLTTAREVNRSIQNSGVSLGKPVYAEIVIEYEPINNHTKKDVFDEIITILKKNNWKGDEWNIAPNYFSMSLKEGTTTMLAKARIHSDENIVSIRMTNRNR